MCVVLRSGSTNHSFNFIFSPFSLLGRAKQEYCILYSMVVCKNSQLTFGIGSFLALLMCMGDAFSFTELQGVRNLMSNPAMANAENRKNMDCMAPQTQALHRPGQPLFTRPSPPRRQSSSSSTALLGIPKMFRWLTDEYPDILNPNLQSLSSNVQVDNFYLDMNGIIHPCTHADDGQIVYLDEVAMFKKIFAFVDRLYKMVHPRKVLYLAVDGVAPRAKMNQQRSRRFRSAKDAEILSAELISKGKLDGNNFSSERNKTPFDSNCITPGTDFMTKLAVALEKWVEYKVQNDKFWKNGANVIISGPDVPGEGEHKVMDFIREERGKLERGEHTNLYGRDWSHILYGLDADLIMLGLVTHEKNFMLLREKMTVLLSNKGYTKKIKKDMLEYRSSDFEVLELSSLRKILDIQFHDLSRKVPNYSIERIIDDFVFLCMLVGNDFIPHCPHLAIDSGGISLMLEIYRRLLPQWKGFLTEKEKIHPQRFEHFMFHVASQEEEHFHQRARRESEPGWALPLDNEKDRFDMYGTYFSGEPTPKVALPANKRGSSPPASRVDTTNDGHKAPSRWDPNGYIRTPDLHRRRNPKSKARSYRDFYYEAKLGWSVEDRSRTLFQRRAHVRDYLEGLHWILNYYHNGCSSWGWFFKHLYSPLASDIVNLQEFYDVYEENKKREFQTFPFELGTPFCSLAQLLSVLPPQSASLLPKPLSELMIHPSSPLTSFYPPDFESDQNGKRRPWEAVAILPFIDADVLLENVQRIIEKDQKTGNVLSASERRRNKCGDIRVVAPRGDSGMKHSEQVKREGENHSNNRSNNPARRLATNR